MEYICTIVCAYSKAVVFSKAILSAILFWSGGVMATPLEQINIEAILLVGMWHR